MSRFLFVVPPLAGHVYAAGAVAATLAGRGTRSPGPDRRPRCAACSATP
ncbi:hypothetical protein [Phytohabitans suffuscus]|nr:hypothetical protein [Phytohabitans suffuscus]